MLTKEQILSKMRGFDCPKYLTESCWQPIYDQCIAAIDLAAENERLKAKAKHYVCIRERNRETIDDLKGKLNASESENERLKSKLEKIRVECKIRQYGVMDSDFDFGLAQMADVIMAIIDKGGEET